MELVGYRWADYDTPLWASPNRSAGRWHVADDGPTQYWALHPLGPWAERIRADGITEADDLVEIRSRLWAARLQLEPDSIYEITFDSATESGMANPGDLVGDNHGACQSLGAGLRTSGYRGLIAPSAALPGTSNLILFGPRALTPYLEDPPDPDLDIPTALLTEHGGPPRSLLDFVCHKGAPHAGFTAWSRGEDPPSVGLAYPWP